MRSSPSSVLFHYHRRAQIVGVFFETFHYIALDFDTVLQEQIVSSALQIVVSFSPSEEFDAPVYNPSLT